MSCRDQREIRVAAPAVRLERDKAPISKVPREAAIAEVVGVRAGFHQVGGI
jgi:hypothetical protein